MEGERKEECLAACTEQNELNVSALVSFILNQSAALCARAGPPGSPGENAMSSFFYTHQPRRETG